MDARKKVIGLKKGFTLLEAAAVLGLIAVTSAAAVATYAMVSNTNRIETTHSKLTELVHNVRGVYANNLRYTGMSSASLINANVIPSDMKVNNTSITTPLGYALTPIGEPTGFPNGTFGLSLGGVEKDHCAGLILLPWGSSSRGIQVGGNVMYPPYAPDKVLSQCDYDGGADITFYFR